MFTLRDYQQDAVDRGVEYFNNPKEKKPVIQILPTGAGKSLIIAGIANRLWEPTLVFQPNKEILAQNYAKAQAYGIEASIYSASFNSKQIGKLTYATIGSVKSKPEYFQHFKTIIVDETHYVNPKQGMYKDFFEVLKDKKILGLTATPYRLASNSFGSELRFLTRTRPRVFYKVNYFIQIKELFDRGYLCPLVYREIPGFDSNELQINSTGAEYTDLSIKAMYAKINFADRLRQTILDLIAEGRKSILVFTAFVDEAKQLIKSLPLNAAGAIVESKMPQEERDRISRNFKNGVIKVVANVGIYTHGFDYPQLDTVVHARPTRSLGLYYQITGRGIRIHPDKPFALIVDMCENVKRFGKIEDLKLTEPSPALWQYETHNGKVLTNVYQEGETTWKSFKNKYSRFRK